MPLELLGERSQALAHFAFGDQDFQIHSPHRCRAEPASAARPRNRTLRDRAQRAGRSTPEPAGPAFGGGHFTTLMWHDASIVLRTPRPGTLSVGSQRGAIGARAEFGPVDSRVADLVFGSENFMMRNANGGGLVAWRVQIGRLLVSVTTKGSQQHQQLPARSRTSTR